MERNRIVFVRDHSASMQSLQAAAAKDFNAVADAVREGSILNNQDTLVSVVECGYEHTDKARILKKNVASTALKPITKNEYTVSGYSTPLWDSVGMAIELLEDTSPSEAANMIFVTTDGIENSSKKWTQAKLVSKMRALQGTDRWTFVFRVPRGDSRHLVSLGIPAGNVIEWDQTETGVVNSSIATNQAFSSYFSERSTGKKATTTFYADLSNVTSNEVEQALIDISSEVQLFPVAKTKDGSAIREFVEKKIKAVMKKGSAFYQLTKTEKAVQDYKLIAIRDKTTNAIYAGQNARKMLGLPAYGNIRLAPDQLGNFEVFIQSTSVNRRLVGGSHVMYWEKAGK